MRKLAMAAALAALVAASPAVAGGKGGDGPSATSRGGAFGQVIRGFWGSSFFSPPGFSSPGKHFGWFFGKHWGWFKPHNPHWPHHPTSP